MKFSTYSGFPGEPPPELRILGGNPHRAGIRLAGAHHHTSHGDQRRCRKAEFLCPEDRRNGRIPPAHQLSVRLDDHLASKAVGNQCLMGLRQSQLPGQSGIMDGGKRRRAGSSVIAGDQDHGSACFCNTGRYRSHSGFGHELHRNTGVFVGIFQIIDQLGQILDGIDIVMGRR